MTPCANAPDVLAQCINRYTDHNVRIWFSHRGKKGDLQPYHEERADLLHFHNMYKKTIKSSVIQYHSEPYLAWCEDQSAGLSLFPPKECKKLVVAQYHAGLEVYKNCIPVRNIIDFENSYYGSKIIKDKIRIGYSPSISDADAFGIWHYKGVQATTTVLKLICREFPNVEVDIITDVSEEECIRRKRECNIIIDECVTPSYHKSGLEGLALGKLTISWVDDKVEAILKKASGSDVNPFHSVYVGWLEDELTKICSRGIDYILEEGRKSREWMEKYWNPRDIVKEYVDIYEGVLNKS
jgi:hypothetical protein